MLPKKKGMSRSWPFRGATPSWAEKNALHLFDKGREKGEGTETKKRRQEEKRRDGRKQM